MEKLRFIDLFAGVGGFHLALSQVGAVCVWACEIRKGLRKLYKMNFPGTPIEGDITKIASEDIPEHDILCAGFPCQPFSLAGKKEGFEDERGNLFLEIIRILDYHQTPYALLENVNQLFHHDDGRTWEVIHQHLNDHGYGVAVAILSPHMYGTPQRRKRVYIVCRRGLTDAEMAERFHFPEPFEREGMDIRDIINTKDPEGKQVTKDKHLTLKLWDEFVHETINHGGELPNNPTWAMELGATYPYWDVEPSKLPLSELRQCLGEFGKPIKGRTREACIACLPIYARTPLTIEQRRIIRQNRAFYDQHKEWLDPWLKKIKKRQLSHQRMEWRVGNRNADEMDIYRYLLQFRSSGIRVNDTRVCPAVTTVTSELPYFPWVRVGRHYGRFITVNEVARLQGLQDIKWGDDRWHFRISRRYSTLGNAINVDVMALVARAMLDQL